MEVEALLSLYAYSHIHSFKKSVHMCVIGAMTTDKVC